MPTFKTPKELEDAINKGLMKTINDGSAKAHQVIEKALHKFYGESEPAFTRRTGQILNSLVKTSVTGGGGTYRASVYFDVGALHHPDSYVGKTGITIESDYSEQEILETVMTSKYHGGKWSGAWRSGQWQTGKTGTSKGTAVWTESMMELDAEFIEFLKNELISNGIPVV